MTIRYEKWKDGIRHYYWLGNISKMDVIITRNKNGIIVAQALDITIDSGMLTDYYTLNGVEHWNNTYINTPQHFIIKDTDTRKHLRLYL